MLQVNCGDDWFCEWNSGMGFSSSKHGIWKLYSGWDFLIDVGICVHNTHRTFGECWEWKWWGSVSGKHHSTSTLPSHSPLLRNTEMFTFYFMFCYRFDRVVSWLLSFSVSIWGFSIFQSAYNNSSLLCWGIGGVLDVGYSWGFELQQRC